VFRRHNWIGAGTKRIDIAMEKRLLLLRHAKAEVAAAGMPDHDRALASRGRRDAQLMGRYFAEHRIDPDVILCSTSRRTRETEEELRGETRLSTETIFLAELYLAPWDNIIKSVAAFTSAETNLVLIVGHNPGLEECAASLTGELVLLSTGAMATIGLKARSFSELGREAGKLQGIVSAQSISLRAP
jgi:phosphohistidine phosphatase